MGSVNLFTHFLEMKKIVYDCATLAKYFDIVNNFIDSDAKSRRTIVEPDYPKKIGRRRVDGDTSSLYPRHAVRGGRRGQTGPSKAEIVYHSKHHHQQHLL